MSLQDQEVTADDLAGLFRVSRRRIEQLAQQGTLTRVARGRYRLQDAVHAMLDELAEREGPSELQAERLRKLRAEASLAELELRERSGELLDREAVQMVMANSYTLIQQSMLNVPQRAVLQLLGCTNDTEFKEKLRAEIILGLKGGRDALQSLTRAEMLKLTTERVEAS